MTQKEIAKLLNVSQPTVSMALNGSERISRELRDAVRKLADRSGYRPNLAGQLLRQGRSNVVGAVFPSLTNNFFAELFQELQNQLIPHGYLLYLVQLGADGELPSAAESLLRLKEDGIALVLYGGDSRLELGVSQVLPDRYAAGREAVRHLLAAGRRRIAFLGMKNPQEPRCRAYRDVLAEAGLEPLTLRAGEDGDSPEAGCRLMRELLFSRPDTDAVFMHNDELAVGALRAALQLGRKVPEELAVFGFDSIGTGRYLSPALTSVEQPRREIAAALVAELLATLADPAHCRFVPVACRLVIRESA